MTHQLPNQKPTILRYRLMAIIQSVVAGINFTTIIHLEVVPHHSPESSKPQTNKREREGPPSDPIDDDDDDQIIIFWARKKGIAGGFGIKCQILKKMYLPN